MSTKFPIVTVVIATYDCERTIEKCLLSIKKQTYPNTDIVVVDSLYYDKTRQERCRKIIEKYARYFQDGPERSIQRNRGIREAKGKYVLIIDQDMYLTENVVKECYEQLLGGNYIALTIPEISIGVGFWTKCVALERYVSTVLDEGMTRFFGRIKKKYYYSQAFRKYLKRYPNIAIRQFFPIKKAYVSHWKIFLKNPILAGGVVLLRSAEVMAGFLGLIIKNKYAGK